LCVAVLARRLPAEPVDRAVARSRDDPSRRARRRPRRRPPLERRRERVLDRFLGNVDVAEDADQDSHRAAVFFAEDTFDRGGRKDRHARNQCSPSSLTGLTSIGSVVARAILRPHSSAPSRSGALIRQKPPICSLPSVNGPSVVSTSPLLTRTTVAVL